MEAKPELNTELESFRQQWRSELKSKKPEVEKDGRSVPFTVASSSKSSVPKAKLSSSRPFHVEDDEEHVNAPSFDEPASTSESGRTILHPEVFEKEELVSALDHYEAAVEKEAVGSLGDSLKLYRKAFRLDDRVDLAYRKKHFAARWQKPPIGAHPKPNASEASVTVSGSTAHNSHEGHSQPQALSTSDLIASFAGLSVEAAPPPVEGDPAPPCPIADLPQEILAHIFRDLVVMDVGDFARLSLVCKRFAYLVATENQVWRRVCRGGEFGFLGMHYHWQMGISWEALSEDDSENDSGEYVSMAELSRRLKAESLATTMALLPDYSSSWKVMFRHRPRVRFNGCYISTVNYIRAGQASVSHVTWASPVHIITYYRYLRLFRDGTAISLLTTAEPGDVVHYLTRELLAQHNGGEAPHLHSAVMQHALRGRWRLSSALDAPDDTPLKESEGELFIETEGVGKYTYRMELALRSAGKGARNNKLAWKGFYSYNTLTDDWAEFALKNDKPFFFSRVRSYGVHGE